mgnify:CR=1 FL=1
MLIKPYLSDRGFVVSLQNCLNEETIAGIVGWVGLVVPHAARLLTDPDFARLLPLSPEGGMSLSAPVLAMVRQRIEQVPRLTERGEDAGLRAQRRDRNEGPCVVVETGRVV